MRKEVEDCFNEGLLSRGHADKERLAGSLDISGRFLEKARKIQSAGLFDIAFLTAYNSMFHSARALLARDGVKERSHFCMVAYLKEAHEKDAGLLDCLSAMDSYRIVRNNIQYVGTGCGETDAKEAINDAEAFLKVVKDRLRPEKAGTPVK